MSIVDPFETAPGIIDPFEQSGIVDPFEQRAKRKLTFDNMHLDPELVETARAYYLERGELTDKEASDPRKIVSKFASDRTWKQANVWSQAGELDYVQGNRIKVGLDGITKEAASEKQKQRLAILKNKWDELPDFYEEGGRGTAGFLENIAKGAVDPVSWVGAAGKGLSFLGRTALGIGADIAAGTGASVAEQQSDVELGRRKEISGTEAAVSGAVSGLASTAGAAIAAKLGAGNALDNVTAANAAARQASELDILPETKVEFKFNEVADVFERRKLEDPEFDSKYAGSINLDNLGAEGERRNLVKEYTEVLADDINKVMQGVKPWSATMRESLDLIGVDPDKYVSTMAARKPGEGINEAKALASRIMETRAMINVMEYANKAKTGDRDALLQYAQAIDMFQDVHVAASGIATTAGRTLNIYKMKLPGTLSAADFQKFMESQRGRDLVASANAVSVLNNPEKAADVLRKTMEYGWKDKAKEAWYNGLLSGISTHVVNTMSGLVTQTIRTAERGIAAGIGKARDVASRVAGQGPVTDRVYFGELAAQDLKEIGQTTLNAVHAAVETFRTETRMNEISGSKLEGQDTKAIGSWKFREGKENKIVEAFGKKWAVPLTGQIEVGGKQVRVFSRFMEASDEFWKTVIGSYERSALAYREARMRGLQGADADKFTAQVLGDNVPDDLKELRMRLDNDAQRAADYGTFTNEGGAVVKSVTRLRDAAGLLGTAVLPFVRTPANIFMFTFERTPFAFAMNRYKEAVAKGGATADEARARLLLGMGIMSTSALLAGQGIITGAGPSDPGDRSVWQQDNQPYSIKIGNGSVSYMRGLEPVSSIIGISATLAEAGKYMSQDDIDRMGGILLTAISDNLVNKTFLQGLSKAMLAATQPDRYADEFVEGLVGTAVPTLAAHFANTQDPYLRDINSIWDVLKARTSWGRDNIPLRFDMTGNPIYREAPIGPGNEFVDRMSSPFAYKTDTDNAVTDEIIRLKYPVQNVSRRSFLSNVPLNDEQFAVFTMLRNRIGFGYASYIVNHPQYKDQSLTDYQRAELIKKAYEQGGKDARNHLLLIYDDLAENKQFIEWEARQKKYEPTNDKSLNDQMLNWLGIDKKTENKQ